MKKGAKERMWQQCSFSRGRASSWHVVVGTRPTQLEVSWESMESHEEPSPHCFSIFHSQKQGTEKWPCSWFSLVRHANPREIVMILALRKKNLLIRRQISFQYPLKPWETAVNTLDKMTTFPLFKHYHNCTNHLGLQPCLRAVIGTGLTGKAKKSVSDIRECK